MVKRKAETERETDTDRQRERERERERDGGVPGWQECARAIGYTTVVYWEDASLERSSPRTQGMCLYFSSDSILYKTLLSCTRRELLAEWVSHSQASDPVTIACAKNGFNSR